MPRLPSRLFPTVWEEWHRVAAYKCMEKCQCLRLLCPDTADYLVYLNVSVVPKATHSSSTPICKNLAIAMTTTSVSTVRIITFVCPCWAMSLTWTKILESASSWEQGASAEVMVPYMASFPIFRFPFSYFISVSLSSVSLFSVSLLSGSHNFQPDGSFCISFRDQPLYAAVDPLKLSPPLTNAAVLV